MENPGIPIEHIRQTAISYDKERKLYNHNASYPELENRKGRNNFDSIIREVERKDDNFKINSNIFQILGWQEFKDYMTNIYIKLLGEEYKTTIESLNQKLRINVKAPIFDSYIEEEPNEKEIYEAIKIHLNPALYSMQLSNLAKGYMMVMMSKFDTDKLNAVIGNIHYRMILPTLMEHIFVKELASYFPKDPISSITDQIHLYFIKNEHKEMQAIESLPSSIRNESTCKVMFEQEQHYFFTQFLGIVYSAKLMEYYEQNPKTILSYIKGILNEEKNVIQMLQEFQVSLQDRNTVQAYMKKLNSLD